MTENCIDIKEWSCEGCYYLMGEGCQLESNPKTQCKEVFKWLITELLLNIKRKIGRLRRHLKDITNKLIIVKWYKWL